MDNNWIAIEEKGMPEIEGRYLVGSLFRLLGKWVFNPTVAQYEFKRWRESNELVNDPDNPGVFHDHLGYSIAVTHWMPLPVPPSPLNEQEK